MRRKKNRKIVHSNPSAVKVANDESPSKVREFILWIKMFKNKPFFALFCLFVFFIPTVVYVAFWPFFTNFITEAKWVVGGFTPCENGVARLLVVSSLLFCVLLTSRKFASRRLKGTLVTIASFLFLILIFGGLSRLEVPKDARMALLAAIEESQDGSVYFFDLQTYGATFSSHMLMPVYYDKSHSPALWMHGAVYADYGRIERALAVLENSGFMIHDTSKDDTQPVESTESYHSFVEIKRWTVTDKGRLFYSRFYWLRNAPCLGFFFAPEYFVPLEGSDETLSRWNKIPIDVLPE